MAEYPDEGSPGVGEEETEERGGENSDEYEPETMTAAEVLEKLEEVSCPLPWLVEESGWGLFRPRRCEYGCVIKQALPTGRMLIFIQAWLNEKFAPELLGYKTDIVECILEIIREMVRKS